jgi:hypothetical protein
LLGVNIKKFLYINFCVQKAFPNTFFPLFYLGGATPHHILYRSWGLRPQQPLFIMLIYAEKTGLVGEEAPHFLLK